MERSLSVVSKLGHVGVKAAKALDMVSCNSKSIYVKFLKKSFVFNLYRICEIHLTILRQRERYIHLNKHLLQVR